MSDYVISEVRFSDHYAISQVDMLLEKEGIKRDANLDYICAMFDDDYQIIATGSCFGSTLRCFAVSSEHRGEGLLNQILSHLITVQFYRGNTHLFLYTKFTSAKFFQDLGFTEIARVEGTLVFMENKRSGFSDYLKRLQKETDAYLSSADHTVTPRIGALVMNANPFTLGHQYLVEQAASECDLLHLFIVSEDASLVPFAVRRQLVKEGTAHLSNVILHNSGPYIISNATFPSYFLKDEASVIDGHARLDLAVFSRISKALGITDRYVGEEPVSQVTGIYNRVMAEALPGSGVQCHIIPRKEANGKAISASTVRRAIQTGDMDLLQSLVPQSTYDYFTSDEAAPVIKRIQNAEDVIHY